MPVTASNTTDNSQRGGLRIIWAWTWRSLALLLAGLLVLNAFDAEPSQEFLQIRDRITAPASVPPERNGYFLGYGMRAPAEMDAAGAMAFGRKIFEADLAAAKATETQRRSGVRASDDTPPAPDALRQRQADVPMFCELRGCLAKVINAPQEAEAYLTKHRFVLDRHRSLVGMDYDTEGWPTYDPLPHTPVLIGLRTDLVAQAIALARGLPDQDRIALQSLDESVRFALKVQATSRELVGAMVATTILHSQLSLLADYVSLFPQRAVTHADLILQIAGRIQPSALSLERAFKGEAFSIASMLLDSARSNGNDDGTTTRDLTSRANALGQSAWGWVVDLFYKPVATGNLFTAHLSRTASVDRSWSDGGIPVDQYRREMLRASNDPWGLWFSTLAAPYNPGGRLVLTSSGDYESYALRRDALIADARLLEVALDRVQGRLDDQQFSSALQKLERALDGERPSLLKAGSASTGQIKTSAGIKGAQASVREVRFARAPKNSSGQEIPGIVIRVP